MKQLELDLGDRMQQLDAIMKKTWLGSGSWYVFRPNRVTDAFWLGIRTHGPVETDYDYVEKVSREEALELVKTRRAYEFMDCLKEK